MSKEKEIEALVTDLKSSFLLLSNHFHSKEGYIDQLSASNIASEIEAIGKWQSEYKNYEEKYLDALRALHRVV